MTELEQMRNMHYLKTAEIQAVFLGGGTPGTLTKEQLSSILQKVRQVLPLSSDCEITVESSIYDMDEEKLAACIENGANRFSFGVQTFATDLRRQLGRPDTCEEVVRKLKLFAATGTKVIIDLIYGLPGQTKELLQRDLQFFWIAVLVVSICINCRFFLGRRWAINLKLIRVISLLGGSWQSSLSAAQNF